MSRLSGSACICNLTKPYQEKVNILCPNPAGGSLGLAQPGANSSQLLAQTIIARFLISQVTKNLEKYILGPLKLGCAEFLLQN